MVDLGGPTLDPEQRTVLLSGRLDQAAVNEAAARLMALDGLSDRPIAVLVNSPGGPLGDVAALLDVLDVVRAPVEVAAMGRAHGTAGILVAGAPGRRLLGPRATLSLRCEDEAPRSGSATELARHAEALASMRDAMAARLARRTGRPEPWLVDQFERGELFTADAAVSAGLVDALAVRTPRP